jgi:enoyl-[acyl-carrier protein] reductase I
VSAVRIGSRETATCHFGFRHSIFFRHSDFDIRHSRSRHTEMDFLGLSGKPVLIFGLANRKSVAYHVGRVLTEAGADVAYSVHTPERAAAVRKLVGDAPVYVCDVAEQRQIDRLRDEIARDRPRLYGVVHSLAFADYSSGWQPFEQTPREAFLRAVDVSCFSLIAIANAFRDLLDPQGSVVTVSISTTRMAAANYGYMAPVKAALDSSVCFLAKSFSESSQVRFNAVCPGLLKTAASAGIPGYVDSYLFAERATLRKRAVETAEVAHTVAFLLSPRSSGINAQGIVIDAGMSVNYFDREIVAGRDPESL